MKKATGKFSAFFPKKRVDRTGKHARPIAGFVLREIQHDFEEGRHTQNAFGRMPERGPRGCGRFCNAIGVLERNSKAMLLWETINNSPKNL